jgi:hypothetical protein
MFEDLAERWLQLMDCESQKVKLKVLGIVSMSLEKHSSEHGLITTPPLKQVAKIK